MISTSFRSLGSLSLALAAVVTAAAPASSQSQLDTAEATDFLGRWDIALSTEYGAFDIDLVIADVDGRVGVSVGGPQLGGMQDVVDVSRSGESLVLNTEVDAQGQIVPITMTLKRDGEDLSFSIDAAGGAYYLTGKATRAAGTTP